MIVTTRAAHWAALTLGAAQTVAAPAPAAAAQAVESDAGMVVTSQHLASEVGAAILRQGGNAIDAAVAVGYALAVTHPCCGNLGGGGFMTIHLADGKDTSINFRERAPLAATAGMFLDGHGNPIVDKSLDGYLAVGVPGTVLGLETARQEYGTLPRTLLLAPAIRLADKGFTLTRGDVNVLLDGNDAFRKQANLSAVFLTTANRCSPGIVWCRRIWRTPCAPSARVVRTRSIAARSPMPSSPPAWPMAVC
jgi:gamma-glutamyltranspeptidase/glutathione hydrolase